MVSALEPEELIRRKVAVGEPDECWPWLGTISRNGYGQVSRQSRMRTAHVVVYEILVGLVPEGQDLDHLCRNRACCNPNHLEPVTRQENVLRGEGLAAINARKTHCVNGHEFTPENTYLGKGRSGRATRCCRTCTRIKQRAYDKKRRARRNSDEVG